MDNSQRLRTFSTAPVFFTAISTILGAILFLRLGFAVGTLGYLGVLFIIIIGHLVTIPTALAISEIATNQKVEGGGEYFIISRSFGLNIGATIGISLFFSQAISIAFYVIAFTEAFEPVFNWLRDTHDINLPRQAISLPAMAVLSTLILSRGANLGIKALYVIVGILFIAILFFFLGSPEYTPSHSSTFLFFEFRNTNDFFIVFAIVFPAFTGMTAGVGLSGDLKKPSRSIPLGTISATLIGMFLYVLITWKLTVSASPDDLLSEQLVMGRIAVLGWLIIPLGLAASTISSALGSVMVAPRTLQALASDRSFPNKWVNRALSAGKGATMEPFNASLITCLIAFIFVALGDVNAVARIISMFFMVTYGSLCLISFLYHFGSDPSYRPTFRSRWYLSLLGFLMCLWLMFKMDTLYAFIAIAAMVGLYNLIGYYNKGRRGLQFIFQGVLYQINRSIQIYLQKAGIVRIRQEWRPSVVCISSSSFEREEAFYVLDWISHKYGFATYIHLIEGYFSKASNDEAKIVLDKLLSKFGGLKSNVYLDTLISPSYTSALAQIVQLPGISGMENNMILFEFNKDNPQNVGRIVENIDLIRAGMYDVAILGSSYKRIRYDNGIHIWIKTTDSDNASLMILLGYIISGHPLWRNSKISIFSIVKKEDSENSRANLVEMMKSGRIPISEKNIEIIWHDENVSTRKIIEKRSSDAGLTLLGFHSERVRHDKEQAFLGYEKMGNILFVNASSRKEIY
jgi:amino acid transporter